MNRLRVAQSQTSQRGFDHGLWSFKLHGLGRDTVAIWCGWALALALSCQLCSWVRKCSPFPGVVRGPQAKLWGWLGLITISNEPWLSFHIALQEAKSSSRRPTFRESVLDKLTLATHTGWNHRDWRSQESAIGDIRNDQEDSEESKIKLLKWKRPWLELKKRKTFFFFLNDLDESLRSRREWWANKMVNINLNSF